LQKTPFSQWVKGFGGEDSGLCLVVSRVSRSLPFAVFRLKLKSENQKQKFFTKLKGVNPIAVSLNLGIYAKSARLPASPALRQRRYWSQSCQELP
jgi:hypothetical protein